MDWPEIDENTDLKTLKEVHKRIWSLVIVNGEKPKTPYTCDCAYCEYSIQRFSKNTYKEQSFLGSLCSVCPIFDCIPLVQKYNGECNRNGPFSDEALSLAKEILNLPNRKEANDE